MNSIKPFLDAAALHSPRYRGELADHLPMALHALHALGASDGELAAQRERYAAQLQPRQSWPAFEAALCELGEEQDIAALVTPRLDALMPCAGADAFHPLIRLGHALAAHHAGEARMALAYWSAAGFRAYAAHELLPEPDLKLVDWIALLDSLPAPAASQPLISHRMQAYAVRADFRAAAFRLRFESTQQCLQQLAQALAARYVRGASFTVLHGLTASLALRLALPLLREPGLALRHFAANVAAALCSDTQRFATAPALTATDWPEVMAAARRNSDEHCVKCVYTCHAWNEQSPAPNFLAAACRAVGAFETE